MGFAVGGRAGAILMRRALVLVLVASCTFEWNSGAPPFPLSGEPPPLTSFEKLNTTPAARATIMHGPDGQPWAVFCEFWSGNISGSGVARQCKRLHLHSLAAATPPACYPKCAAAGLTDQLIDGDTLLTHPQAIYAIKEDTTANTRTLTMLRPGEPTGPSFVMPGGQALVYENDPIADVFVYWVLDPSTTHFDVFRRDKRYQLTLPIPAGVDPMRPGAQFEFDFLLTKDGGTLVVRDMSGQMTAYSTLDGSSRPLGMRPQDFRIDDLHGAVLTIGDDGLREVPLAGGPDVVLAPQKVDPTTLQISGNDAFYSDAMGVWWLTLDGMTPPTLIGPGGARWLATAPDGEFVYSRDSATRYTGGAGDGWIGNWRFMERGRNIRFNAAGDRIYFLEHAATIGNYGDLHSVGNDDVLLATNVHAYAVLDDGRVVAVENAVYAGAWNRLVVINQAEGIKRWVVPSAADFVMVPGGKDMIVDVVSGASGYDILRVPAP